MTDKCLEEAREICPACHRSDGKITAGVCLCERIAEALSQARSEGWNAAIDEAVKVARETCSYECSCEAQSTAEKLSALRKVK